MVKSYVCEKSISIQIAAAWEPRLDVVGVRGRRGFKVTSVDGASVFMDSEGEGQVVFSCRNGISGDDE